MIGGGEVMEVMMTGGDGSAMNEDTLAQVVNMLQTEGQLTGGNHTIIIRQPDSDEIQMIQTTNNGGELVVTKASAEEIQALQAANIGQEILEPQQGGQVVMMDETGNLVEGMVQMQEPDPNQAVNGSQVHLNENGQMQVVEGSSLANVSKSAITSQHNEILDGFVSMTGVDGQNLLSSELQPPDPPPVSKQSPISISTTTKKPLMSPPSNKVVSIKINTGVERRREPKRIIEPSNVIKISTVTGRQKTQPPKFHKCENCTINFVSKVAYMNHMENCPSKKKNASHLPPKGNITYTCVFCETKFNSRLILMQHVRTCDKAKATKSQSIPKPKTTSESKLKVDSPTTKSLKDVSPTKKTKKDLEKRGKNEIRFPSKRTSLLDMDEDDVDRDLASEPEDDEKGVVYDDEDDLNEFMDDDDDEGFDDPAAKKHSLKHLGPIITKGTYKCRDCSRTFSKEYQYNRHIKACTNAPLNASRIVNDLGESSLPHDSDDLIPSLKRKKGSASDIPSPKKKKIDIPKIVSIDPKKVVSSSKRFSDEDSDEEPYPPPKSQKQSLSKIVKISPSDTLIKKTGKAMLSKMNQKSKVVRENAFCGLCGDKFKTVTELALHTQASHSEDVLNTRDLLDGKGSISSVKCPLCDFNFVSSQMLLFHMVSYHSRELKNVSEELETLNLNLLCPFCNLICPSQDLLKEHFATIHLDKINAKTTTSVISMNIDIHALIKEKNNGSILPTAKLLTKQEKVLCPDCGLFLLKSYFEHHRCAAESYSPSSRKFVCSESQCSGMTFYKLIHLLTHLQQVHEKSMPCQSSAFDSMTQFIDWLKKEEGKSKVKYTKALQRMKQGKLTSIWTCHRFHSASKDVGTKDEIQRIDRLKQCYSRIHAETHFNTSTTRYDGKTLIKYYPEHRHIDPAPKEETPPPKKEVTPTPVPPNPKTAFTDAAELKQLLEDDGDSSQNEATEDEVAIKETSEKESEKKEETDKTTQPTKGEDAATAMDVENNADTMLKSTQEAETAVPSIQNTGQALEDRSGPADASENPEKETEDADKKAKEPSPVNLSDADMPEDLLLEKMLAEENTAIPTEKPKGNEDVMQSAEPKISDVDMFEAFGVATDDTLSGTIPAEENSSTSTASNTQQSTSSSSSQPQEIFDGEKPKETEESEMDVEENTYVLPADLEEWNKLFELVHSQVDADSLSGEELLKAKELLIYEDQITKIPIEKQVEVFNRLCTIANVQMT